MSAENRIKVSVTTRVVSDGAERAVQLVALSAKSALTYAPEPFGGIGDCVELYLPSVGKADVQVLAGIERIDKVVEGHATTLRYIVADAETRKQLNELLALLLDGDGGGSRRHPRIFYDVIVTFGNQKANLEQLSLSGLSMVVTEPLAVDQELTIRIPEYGLGPGLVVTGRVVNQRPAPGGGHHIGLAFGTLDVELRKSLSRLLADLMCR